MAAAAAMAPALLLLVVVVFHLPTSVPATATLNPIGDLFAKANDTTTSSPAAATSASAAAPAPAAATVSSGHDNGNNKKLPPHQAAAAATPVAGHDNGNKQLPPHQAAAAAPAGSAKEKEKEKEEREKKEMEEIDKEKKEAAANKKLVSIAVDASGAYKGMTHEFLEGHNVVRKRYGVPAMKWNPKLARFARRWSNAMRKDCESKHSSGSNYGENVFVSRKNTWNATAKDAIWTWLNEEKFYDRATENCTAGHHYRECGHFKNMVNEKLQKVGCARGECYKGGVFMSCNYYVYNFDP
ncbi:hypothetical protein EJB05_55654, partial [Eragrostis curvula]